MDSPLLRRTELVTHPYPAHNNNKNLKSKHKNNTKQTTKTALAKQKSDKAGIALHAEVQISDTVEHNTGLASFSSSVFPT